MDGVDQAWFLAVSRFAVATPWLHGPAVAWAQYGVVVFALLLLGSWWTVRPDGPDAVASIIVVGVATLAAVAVNQPVVAMVAESRPYAALPGVLVLVARTSDPAFPSDHATIAGAVAVGLLIAARRYRVLRGWVVAAVLSALLMAAARVYVGAHYPVDVAAGLLLGGTVALLVRPAALHPVTRLAYATAHGPLRALVTSAPRPGGREPGDDA